LLFSVQKINESFLLSVLFYYYPNIFLSILFINSVPKLCGILVTWYKEKIPAKSREIFIQGEWDNTAVAVFNQLWAWLFQQ
jgi:hypothetical protein